MDVHNVIAVFKTILRRMTVFPITEATNLFSEATGYDFMELFPQANEELPVMFKSIYEFKINEDEGTVSLKDDTQENMDGLKQKYLVTADDKKCK